MIIAVFSMTSCVVSDEECSKGELGIVIIFHVIIVFDVIIVFIIVFHGQDDTSIAFKELIVESGREESIEVN